MKFIYITSLIFCVGLFITSCNGDKQSSINKIKDDIISKGLYVSDSLTVFLGLPTDVCLFGNLIFVNDFFGEKGHIQIIDLNADSIFSPLAKKGNGPNEYISVSNVDIYEKEDFISIGLLDITTKRYSRYDLKELLLNKSNSTPYFRKKINNSIYFQ